MTAPDQVLVAELRIVTDRSVPTATLVCHMCATPARTVRGRAAVAEYVRSNPLHAHRLNCPGRPHPKETH